MFTNRYRPDFEWGPSIVSNCFRAFEMFFGRRFGIRKETATWFRNGKVRRTHYTWESRLAHIETAIREWFWKLSYVRVRVAYLDTGTGMRFPVGYSFAIALDVSNKTVFGASPETVSHTITGSNPILFSSVGTLNDTLNALSQNGTSFLANQVNKTSFPGGGRVGCYLHWIAGPTSGTFSCGSSSGNLGGMTVSYSGASQTGIPDSSAETETVASGASLTMTTTVVAANCWLVAAECDASGASYTGGAGTTLRQTDANGFTLSDSNATVGTGSQSLVVNMGTNSNRGGVVASFAPAGAAGGRPPILLTLLGVG